VATEKRDTSIKTNNMAIHRDKEKLTVTSHILLYTLAAGGAITRMMMCGQIRHALYPDYATYIANRRIESILYRLYKQGWLTVKYTETDKVISLTRKGQLEALLEKARLPVAEQQAWDGKWRMVVFDIPQRAQVIRDRLRDLLKEFGFKALQASVYVYPFALHAEAVQYLKQSGLMRYIRFARVDAFDDDKDLRREFRDVISKSGGHRKT
jgi:predicted transcriptional regulator